MRATLPFAAALLAGASVLPLPAAGQEDPWTLRSNPFKKGLAEWTRTGPEKAFTWVADAQTLSLKGQVGKDVPTLVFKGTPWDRGELRLQAKRPIRKLRFRLEPVPAGPPVVLELPGSALKGGNWCDVAVRLLPGKAVLLAVDAAGAETEVASAPLPAGTCVRFGFEAPHGVEGIVSNVRLSRTYEDEPQVREEGFESTFDGQSLGSWRAARPEFAPALRVEKGLLVCEVRTEEVAWFGLLDRTYKEYELRMRALWGSDSLEVRAYEVAGAGGSISKFETVQQNLSDHLDAANVNDIVVRVAGGKAVFVVNGKTVAEAKVKESLPPTYVSLFVHRGKRLLLRDIRIRDLAPGAGGEAPREPAAEEGRKAPEGAAAVDWTPSGGFSAADGVWSVEAAGEKGAGLACRGGAPTFEVRFKVAKGASGLSVVPRVLREIDRDAGIPLADALFAKEEWTEVVVKVGLVSAKVLVAGAEAGSLDLDDVTGNPGLRVRAGGRASIKDLSISAKR
jgi:hypothetical protein